MNIDRKITQLKEPAEVGDVCLYNGTPVFIADEYDGTISLIDMEMHIIDKFSHMDEFRESASVSIVIKSKDLCLRVRDSSLLQPTQNTSEEEA